MSTKKKLVYVPMAVDFIHPGHLNIIKVAAGLGEVMVGLFTDKAIASYKRLPFMSYEQRKEVIENVKGVDQVVMQEEADYEVNLRKYKPDFMVHGTDWRQGPLKEVRDKAIAILSEWGGKVVEPEYTKGISSTEMHVHLRTIGTTTQQRLAKFRRVMEVKPLVRVMESHNGLSALIAERTEVKNPGRPTAAFDAIWLSGLTESVAMGKPDLEVLDFSSRTKTINDIFEVTVKPMIYDGGTGGNPERFVCNVRTLERLGVSAIAVGDESDFGDNSILGADSKRTQGDIEDFCQKISLGKKSQVTNDFMIIAQIESLILKKGMDDALLRATSYIAAGADGILIHSREKGDDEVLAFCSEYRKIGRKSPLMVISGTYSHIYEEDLIAAGASVIIYANHLLSAAYPAMVKAAESILRNGNGLEASNNYCMPVLEMMELFSKTR
jgi:phosphoenolpyruvate phosphomutase